MVTSRSTSLMTMTSLLTSEELLTTITEYVGRASVGVLLVTLFREVECVGEGDWSKPEEADDTSSSSLA